MSTALNREVLQHRANLALIIAFFALLWLPTAETCLKFDRTPPPNENRILADIPKFKKNLKAMRIFFSGIEAYFGDHFGFRNRLVSWERHWKFHAFRISRTKDVIIGMQGWLFYTGPLMFDDTMGRKPLSLPELEAWREFFTERRDWLAQRGIRYLFVIPPDKHTIYPEHLPTWLARTSRPPQRLDQFISHMKAHSDLPILDLRPSILEAKKDARVYMQTDTHWNAMGAFIGYRSIMQALESQGLPVQPLDVSTFSQSTGTSRAGDLAVMLGLPDLLPEKDDVFLTHRAPFQPVQIRVEPGLLKKKWVPTTEPVVSENPQASGRLLLFRDSFAGGLIPLLAQHFNRSVSIWQYNWDRPLIEKEKPDVVIDEMVERSLIALNPAYLKAMEE